MPNAPWPHYNLIHHLSYPQFFTLPTLNSPFQTHSPNVTLRFLDFTEYHSQVLLLGKEEEKVYISFNNDFMVFLLFLSSLSPDLPHGDNKTPNNIFLPILNMTHPFRRQVWKVLLMQLTSSVQTSSNCLFALPLSLSWPPGRPPCLPHLQKMTELLEVNQFYWTRKGEAIYCARPTTTHLYWNKAMSFIALCPITQ